MTEPFTHAIDLSSVPHRPGQSPDLEPKRRRAWERMDDRERRYIVPVYERPVDDWKMPCLAAGGAYERVLYVLATTGSALSADQVAYLLIARHYRNADIASVRKQMAVGVRRGHIRNVGPSRYAVTTLGVNKMRRAEADWLVTDRVRQMRQVAAARDRMGPLRPAGPPRPPGPPFRESPRP